MKHWSHLQPDKEPLKSFIVSLDQLFDVAYTDLYNRMASSGNPRWSEDYQFYQDQKKVPQVGSMSGCDKVLEGRVQRQQMRDAQKKMCEEKEAASAAKQQGTPEPDKDADSDSDLHTEDRTCMYIPPLRYQHEQQRKPEQISLSGVSRTGLLSATTAAAT